MAKGWGLVLVIEERLRGICPTLNYASAQKRQGVPLEAGIQMVSSDQETFEGYWWPFGAEDRRQAGTLTIGDNLTLRLISDGSGPSRLKNPFALGPTTFVGICPSKTITLYGCQSTGRHGNLFGGVEVATHQASKAVIGAYSPPDEDPLFDSITFRLTQLNTWVGRNQIHSPIDAVTKHQVSWSDAPNIVASIPGGTVAIGTSVHQSWNGAADFRLKQIDYIEITFSESRTTSEMLNLFVYPIIQLLMLASGEVSDLADITVTDTDTGERLNANSRLSLRLSSGNDSPAQVEAVHTALMRFTLQTAGIPFDSLLPTWFEIYDKVGDDCALLFSLKGKQTINVWDDFFKVASAAEGMHRKWPSSLHRNQGRPTFRDRLVALIDEVGDAAMRLTGDSEEWAKLVVDYRNVIAHSDTRDNTITTINRVVSLKFSIEILLEMVLLRRLGLSEQHSVYLLDMLPSWGLFAGQIRRDLPELFGQPSDVSAE